MSGIETRFRGEDAERIRCAFYGFLAEHADDVDGDAHICTEMDDGRGPRIRVRLWSAEAMDAFLNALAAQGQSAKRRPHE